MSMLFTVTGSAPRVRNRSLNSSPRRHAHAHPLEIGRRDNRTGRRSYLPHAVVERTNRKAVNALGRHLRPKVGAESAVHRGVCVRRRSERERHLLHVGHGHHGAQQAAHQREEVDVTRDQQLERCGVASLNVVVQGKHFRFDASPRLAADCRPHFREPLVQRAVGGLVVVLRECEFWAAGLRPGRRGRGGSGCECREKRTSSDHCSRRGRSSMHCTSLRNPPYNYCFQATRSGLPIMNAASAPLRGLNFWAPPLSTAAVYTLPSWSTANPCTPHMPPGNSPHVPQLYMKLPFRSYFSILLVPRSAAHRYPSVKMWNRWTSDGFGPKLH